MSGNREGSAKAVKTIKERHGEDFFRKIGVKGGKASVGGGFAYGDHTLAKEAGSTGGKRGKRGFKLLEDLGGKGRYLDKATNKEVVLSYE